jgi:hypothetical protein
MHRPRRSSQTSDPIETVEDSNPAVRSEPSGNGSGLEIGSGVAGDATDSIALRAYQRFEDRGREHGRDLEDWIEAEREVTNRNVE